MILPLASRAVYEQRYAEADKAGSPGGPGGPVATGGPAGWQVPYWLVDTSMATMLLLLAAEEAGLGALLFALHADPRPWLRGLGVPDDWQPLGAVALGWPAGVRRPGRSARRGRKTSADVVHRGRW